MSGYGVIVHAGAGYHSENHEAKYKAVCATACRAAIAALEGGRGAVAAVEAALISLEDAAITNAGIGSCLTLEGTVECDAALHCAHSGFFGGVGALSSIRNASAVAAALLRQQLERPTLEMGRIPPSILVGEGARKWALDNGHTLAPSASLVSAAAMKSYCKYKRRLDRCMRQGAAEDRPEKMRRPASDATGDNATDAEPADKRLDTVGVVCVDSLGHVVAGASSGGIAMKFPGRIGQVCVPGAGCWAEEAEDASAAVGVATSGTGEHLIRTHLAMRVAQACLLSEKEPQESVYDTFDFDFMRARSLAGVGAKNAGLIGLRAHPPLAGDPCLVEFIYAHSTRSLALGYMTSKCQRPTVFISRSVTQPPTDGAAVEQRITLGGQVIKLG